MGNGSTGSDYADDDFWAAFDEVEDYVPRTPWYRKTARIFAALIVAGMIGTGALVPWGEAIGRWGNLTEPAEIRATAAQAIEESPYGWLVTAVVIEDITNSRIGAFVNWPPDGIITIDFHSWNEDDLRETVAHEIGHLLDFAAYGSSSERRDGLGSEAWAECAAVDAGLRQTDGSTGNTEYHCTADELDSYRFSVSRLGEVCKTWGVRECRVVEPIG